jgi:hypothetical protein
LKIRTNRASEGVFNFIGGLSKILLGTMDSEDASYYAEKISSLEKEQIDFLKLSKEDNCCQGNPKVNEFHFTSSIRK